MFTKHTQIHILILVITSLLITACNSSASDAAQPLSNADYSRVYRFQSLPNQPLTLQVNTQQDIITYSAQVSDHAGNIITRVNDTTLQAIQLTIPAGNTEYLIQIATQKEVWLDDIEVTIKPKGQQIPSNTVPSASTMNIAYTSQAALCEAWVMQNVSVYLYNQPNTTTQPLLALPINTAFTVDARTLEGWYRMILEGHTGWVNGNQVQLRGGCSNLPVDTMIQPTSPTDATNTAPYDVDRHYFAINANQGGRFANKISYPNGDSTDIIQATLSDYQADRHIGVVMTCTGTGVEVLRWGYAQGANLGCGDTLELDYTQLTRDIQLTAMIPAVTGQQYVDYQLTAMPIAPTDEDQHVMAVDRNQGGVIQQTISYPVGDSQDTVAVYAHNLKETSPNNYRDYTLIMECHGTQVENLRWGTDTAILSCGEQLTLPVSSVENVHYVTVNIPANDGQSFIDYTLYALPSAQGDDDFWFGIDRDYGGTFSETLSAPLGDSSDKVEIIMSNLTQTTPNQFREMTLTLDCDGFNQANIRWGLPGNPSLSCGQTVTAAFVHSANRQMIQIQPLDANVQSYVNYTLVVAPKVDDSILKNQSG